MSGSPQDRIVIPPGVRRAATIALLGASAAVTACDGMVEPAQCALPEISGSSVVANPANVLSALVKADVRSADSVAVKLGRSGASLDAETPATPAADSVRIAVLGLREETSYDLQVLAFNSCGVAEGGILRVVTGMLPADMPRYTATGSDPSPGYVAFAAGNYGLVIDNSGRVVWYHRFPNGPGLNFQPQPNGRYAARPNPASPGGLASWVEVDPVGRITRSLGCARGLQPRLHDLIAEPNGSYWIMCDETRAVDLSSVGRSSTSMVQGTIVQHVSAAGELLFEWSAFPEFHADDLAVLEPADLAGATINWTHGNAIDLDSDGNLLVSFRNTSEIIKISTRTRAVMWRLGGLRNQFTLQNVSAPAFARQHGVRAAAGGQLVLLDNLGDRSVSRAERYRYDEGAKTVELIGSYTSSPGVVALLGGTTQNLPGARVLVAFGSGGSVEEYDAQGNVVWRIEGNPGYVFRATRIRSLYSPGAGDPR